MLALAAGIFVVPAVASAQDTFPDGSFCYASGSLDTQYADLAQDASRWICEYSEEPAEAARYFIRFDVGDDAEIDPQEQLVYHFYRTDFDRLETLVIDTAGSEAREIYGFLDPYVTDHSMNGFILLPETKARPALAVITIDNPAEPLSFAYGYIDQDAPFKINAGWLHLLVALICGLLLAPALFDLGYYRTLGEKFPLYHSLFCLTATVQTAAMHGLLPLLFEISFDTELLVSEHSFNLMLVATLLFAHSFIEDGILDLRHRNILAAAAIIPVLISMVHLFEDHRPIEMLVDAIYGGLGLMLLALFYVMAVAWRRGSKAVRWLTLALAPLLANGVIIVGMTFIPALYLEFHDAWAQSLALLFEVSVTSFAVAGRFMTIKRERDSAVHEARSLEALSERDALTGLLNRRALESRFDLLRAEGFNAIALLDLDHFKSVNDTYGHQMGDEVLSCAANAIRGRDDPNLLAFRIGGEEFLILLRGRTKQARAEARRTSVTTAIAKELSIDRQITASMGYVEATMGALADASFDTLYDRADRLLYEAKERGRNRTVVEKVRVFRPRTSERRTDKHAA